jgi:hypothetical protein
MAHVKTVRSWNVETLAIGEKEFNRGDVIRFNYSNKARIGQIEKIGELVGGGFMLTVQDGLTVKNFDVSKMVNIH